LLALGDVAAEPSTIAGFARLYLARDCVALTGDRDAELGMGKVALLDDAAVRALERDGGIFDSLTLVGLARARDAG
ncbi:MAG: hypothetical protein NBV67_17805, partial [Tagaea sp.]|nr:hypothetical protein [Tagaea sp.]